MKRLFDILAAAAGLVLVAPVLLATAIAVRITSAGPVFFRQERIGRGVRPFFIFKFRTMVHRRRGTGRTDHLRRRSAHHAGRQVPAEDANSTNCRNCSTSSRRHEPGRTSTRGAPLRRDVSRRLQRHPASAAGHHRSRLDQVSRRGRGPRPGGRSREEEYVRVVLPEKIRLAKEYVARRSLWLDLAILFGTALASDLRPSCARSANRNGVDRSS